jgi:hypothetical protein
MDERRAIKATGHLADHGFLGPSNRGPLALAAPVHRPLQRERTATSGIVMGKRWDLLPSQRLQSGTYSRVARPLARSRFVVGPSLTGRAPEEARLRSGTPSFPV